MQSNSISFGKLIREHRKSMDLSQREFAKLLKIEWSTLAKIENDHLDITLREYDTFVKSIAQILQFDINELQRIREQTEVVELDFSLYFTKQ